MKLTLTLNKQMKGYYSNKIDNIEIIVSSCADGSWEGIITDDNNEDFIIYKCYGNFKKEVYSQIVKELTK